MERNGSESFTLFVDNLPVDVGILWFRNFFNRFGVVKDAFIPSKRSKITNRRFGFIRYNCATSADMAISKANGVWIENRKLFVKFAAFKDHRKEATGGLKHTVIDSNRIGGRSYAEAVVGKKVGAPKCVIINDNPNEWLHRIAVAKLKSLATMEAIREAMHCEGIPEIEVKDMGGLWVVLTFPNAELLQEIFDEGKLSWFRQWFVEVRKWSPEFEATRTRNVWISCNGVPLHGWSAVTFHKIASLWGEVICMDDATVKGYSFGAGKVMIATEVWDRINDVIHVDIKGKLFEVRVMEEQVVIQGHCSSCKFNSFESSKASDSPHMEVVYDSAGDSLRNSIDEVNSRQPAEPISTNSTKNKGTTLQKPEVAAGGISRVGLDGDPKILSSSKKSAGEDGVFRDGNGSDPGNIYKENVVIELEPCQNNFGSKDLDNSSHGLASFVKDSGGVLMTEAMVSLQRNEETHVEEALELMDTGLEGLQKEFEVNHAPIQAAIKGVKGKNKRKNINDILGYSKVEKGGNIKGRRNKNKCVVMRSAIASAALSASLSSECLNNRNRILLDEAKAIWEVDRLFGISYDGDEEEVVNKIAEMEALNKARVDCQH